MMILAFLLSQSVCAYAEEAPQGMKFSAASLRVLEMQRRSAFAANAVLIPKMSLSLKQKPSVPGLSLKPAELDDSPPLLFNEKKERETFFYRLELPEKEFMPRLYYEHFEPEIKWFKDEGYDDVGRIWKLSKRTKLLFPFGRWEYPGIRDRILLGGAVVFRW